MKTIEPFAGFEGQHCETTATGALLTHAGLELSEAMLFGLGQGLSYGVFVMKNMPAPFIGGRPRLEQLTKTLADNLSFEVEYRTTRSAKRAWENLASFVDNGQPVAAKLNCYFLDYFSDAIHFAGHYVAVYGYDDESIYVIDTDQQGSWCRTGRARFEEGRLWKGPMSSNAMTWTVADVSAPTDWQAALVKAITRNMTDYLNPPIANFGPKGIRKTAKLVPTWLETVGNATTELAQLGMIMERGGTGGGLFRTMYRDFLLEANERLELLKVDKAAKEFAKASRLWTQVSQRLSTLDGKGQTALDEASEILLEIATIEEAAATELATLEN